MLRSIDRAKRIGDICIRAWRDDNSGLIGVM